MLDCFEFKTDSKFAGFTESKAKSMVEELGESELK